MKHYIKILTLFLCCSLTVMPATEVNATPAVILKIIKEAIVKVIKAIDLKIQRLQNKTIRLQNVQKALENALSKSKLKEIADWTQRQKDLYKNYFDELAKVKSIISYYHRVKEIAKTLQRLIDEYHRAWNLLRGDNHFSADELLYMAQVYSGILDRSAENVDQLTMIVKSLTTTMSDAQRLELINRAADRVESNYDDLTRFNRQNMLLSLQRTKEQNDVNVVRELYGLPAN